MQQSGHSLLLFCVPLFIPCPLLPLRPESTLLGLKDVLHILSVSRANVSERLPKSSEPFVTLGFPIFTFYVCVHPLYFEDTRDSLSRTSSEVYTSFFPGSHLRVSRTSRV